MTKPRQITPEEGLENFYKAVAGNFKYWRDLPTEHLMLGQQSDKSEVHARMEGFLFSLLVTFDGGSMATPAFDICPAPHPEDKGYCKTIGENWWGTGAINRHTAMHETFNWERLK